MNNTLSSNIISLTSKLISFQTFEKNFSEYEKCFSFIDQYLHDVPGLKKQLYKADGFPSVLYYFNRASYSKINFNGHIDVVNGKKEQFTAKKEGTSCLDEVHMT